MSHQNTHTLPLAIFLLLAGVYLLSTGGHTYASDEEQLFGVAASLAEHGGFALNAGTGQPPAYSNYGPGQPLLALPLYLLGRAVAAGFPDVGAAYLARALVGWLNPLVTAASAALVALAALRLGYGRRAAASAALLFGLATLAWPHSKTFFAEPLAACLSFAAFVAALGPAGAQGRGLARYALAGLLAALACAVKIQAGLALPLLGLWALGQGAGQWRRPAAFTLGALGGLAPLGLYQWALFGSPLRSGYGGASGVFSGDMAAGLYGLLLSPGKGIVWYAPPLALLPAGLWLLWRRSRGAALLCGGLALATLLLYSRVIFWHGDGAWGPRYLNMALPFAALPLAAVAEAALGGPRRRAAAVALAATIALALPVQLAGEAISLNAYLGVQRDAAQRYFVPAQSPILGHLRLAAAQLGALYGLAAAPATIALRDGFSYSEGDRAAGEQLPRWTLPLATLALRPPPAAALRVELGLGGCRPAPLPAAELTLRLDGAPLGALAACPPRRVALLLPGRPASIEIASGGWQPSDAGIDREGPLGVYLSRAAAWADGRPLALRGTLVPIPPLPAGPVALRQWTSDYRYGHWDVWWWYLAHSGLPAGPSLALGTAWAGLGLGLLAAGGRGLRRELGRREGDL